MNHEFARCVIAEYGIIVNSQNQFLLLKMYQTEKYPGENWMLPGGRLETTDRAEEALLREIREETGLAVEVLSPCHVANWLSEGEPKYIVFFLCRLAGEARVKLSHEHPGYRWAEFSDLDSLPIYNPAAQQAINKSKRLNKQIFSWE